MAERSSRSWDPTTCEHCGSPMSEPKQVGNRWMNHCTFCGSWREVPTSSPLLQQQRQQEELSPYPAELQQVQPYDRPWVTAAEYQEWWSDRRPDRRYPRRDYDRFIDEARQSPYGDLSPYTFDHECYELAEGLEEDYPDLKMQAGLYVHPRRGPGDHAWNRDSQGNIVDTTALQHGRDHPVVISPDDPRYQRYVSWEDPRFAQIAQRMTWCPYCLQEKDKGPHGCNAEQDAQKTFQAFSGVVEPWPLSASLRQSETDSKPWEGKMFHGSQRGLLGPVRVPFWTTSHEPEAQDYGGVDSYFDEADRGVVHPVSVRFQRPLVLFGGPGGTYGPDWREQADAGNHDGVVVHFAEDNRDPSNPLPKRQWAIALDPGSVVPGHDHEWPYGSPDE